MKIKIINGYTCESLERGINEFIRAFGEDRIINIQYAGAAGLISLEARYYSAMITYKE
jgi:hypothetical protein